jgi:pilus assembly protein CpaE
VESLLGANAVQEVFLTSKDTTPQMLVKAIRTGAKEFLPQPLVDDEVRQALERARQRREAFNHKEPVKLGQVITVMGSKGGVGATTVAVNLAVAMTEMEPARSVVLIDMNLLFGEIPLFLELKPRYHWGEIAKQIYRLDADFLMNILSKHPSGVHVLPSPSYFHYDQEEIPRIMGRVLNLARRMFDVIVIDAGCLLGKLSSKTLEMSNKVVLVSTLSVPCLSNTTKLLESFRSLGYPRKERIRIVVNRHTKNAEISVKEAEESLHRSVFWTLPNDYRVTMSAINQGRPISEIAPKASMTRSLKSLANRLLETQEAEKKKKAWWRFGARSEPKAGETTPLSTAEKRMD